MAQCEIKEYILITGGLGFIGSCNRITKIKKKI